MPSDTVTQMFKAEIIKKLRSLKILTHSQIYSHNLLITC